MKSRKLDLIICIACGLLFIGYVFIAKKPIEHADTFLASVRELNLWWIALAVCCMVVYWLMESIALHLLLKKNDPDRRFFDTVRVAMGGQYYNSVTPFATGGQPFQMYYLTRQGMDLGDAAGALLGRFLVYQAALVVLSTVLLILKWQYFVQTVANLPMLVFIGYAVNFAVLAVLVAVGLFRGAADRVFHWLIRLGGKVHLLKDPAEKEAHAEVSLTRFHSNFRSMLRHAGRLWVGFFLSLIQLLAYLGVPWCIYKAFGLSEMDLLTVLAAGGFVMMIASFVPIPGASLGAEISFGSFFGHMFSVDGQVDVATILWRLLTLYLTLVVGVGFALRAGKKHEKGGPNDS